MQKKLCVFIFQKKNPFYFTTPSLRLLRALKIKKGSARNNFDWDFKYLIIILNLLCPQSCN